jgi:hypothetical protein
VVAVILLVPLSLMVVGGGLDRGVRTWQQFLGNTAKHYATPATNNMGLRVVVAYEPGSRVSDLANYWVDAPWDARFLPSPSRRSLFRGPITVLSSLSRFSLVLPAAVRRLTAVVRVAYEV